MGILGLPELLIVGLVSVILFVASRSSAARRANVTTFVLLRVVAVCLCAVGLDLSAGCSLKSTTTAPEVLPPLLLMAVLPNAGSGSPTADADGIAIGAGESREYRASGGSYTCINYEWSLPNGGGTLTPLASNSRVTFTAGAVGGTFTIRVVCQSQTTDAKFTVITPAMRTNSIALVSSYPLPGPSLLDKITLTVDYVTAEDGLNLSAVFLDSSRKPVNSGGGSAQLGAAGRVILDFLRSTGSTSFVVLKFGRTGVANPLLGIFSVEYPMEYHWK